MAGDLAPKLQQGGTKRLCLLGPLLVIHNLFVGKGNAARKS
jgi:hypothetical protein